MGLLEYEERGEGPALCLAHAGVFSAWFGPMFGERALDGFRLIRLVRPGYGRSAPPTEPASLRAHAWQCAEFLGELGVRRAYWVGHSSSCCIGLQLALDHPDLVAGLVLFETAKPSGPLREANAGTYVGPALSAAREGDVSRAFDIFLRGVGGEHYRSVLLDRLGEAGVAEAERESAYFFADELPAVGAWQFDQDDAARVLAPTLLVRGAESKPWFAENMAQLAAWMPAAREVTLQGCDHLAPLTRPAALAAATATFVQQRETGHLFSTGSSPDDHHGTRSRGDAGERAHNAGDAGGYGDVNEVHMYYETHGEGPPLLQLHGGTCSNDQLDIPFFAMNFQVIAPEQMGHGRTPDDTSRPFSYHDMAEDTVALLRHLDIDSALVLGFSDGGVIGLDMAIHHPDLVSKLVITGANFSNEGYTDRGRNFLMTADPDDWPQAEHEAYERLSPDGPSHWPIVLERLRAMWAAEPNFTPEQLARIKAPTLVISGDRDMVRMEHTVELFRAIPDAQLCVLPGTGHGALPEHTIASFLMSPDTSHQ